MAKTDTINPRFFIAVWALLISGWGCLLISIVRGVPLNTIHEFPLQMLRCIVGVSCSVALWEELWFFYDLGRHTWYSLTHGGESMPAISNRGVYLIKSSDAHYKIGQSTNVRARLNELQGASPLKLSLEYVIPCANLKIGEAYLHGLFASRRLHGEWFDLTPVDVKIIKGIEAL